MTDPLAFDSVTPRLELPLLFVGQAQKEFTVNEALLRADLALQCVVEDERDAPPAAPEPGRAWLVGTSPLGDFVGHSAAIAGYTGNGWRFIPAQSGYRVFDKSKGCFRHFAEDWQLVETPSAPTGGATVDGEARAAIVSILENLVAAGVFAAN